MTRTLMNRTRLHRTRIGALAALLVLSSGCKDFLDVNENPNAPQVVSANLYLSPMLHWMTTSPQLDGRFAGRYTQQCSLSTGGTVPSTVWGGAARQRPSRSSRRPLCAASGQWPSRAAMSG